MLFHPARAALAVLFAIVLFAGALAARIRRRGGRVREIYHRHFERHDRERRFFAAVSFYTAFAGVRVLTHAIRAGRGPFHNLEVGGRHIHHLVWGILLLLLVGYGWMLQVGTDPNPRSRWVGRVMAMFYGVGAALTLDEFALWLNLRDVYWERQGRASIDAVVLFGALLLIAAAGGGFLRTLAREAKRVADHGGRRSA